MSALGAPDKKVIIFDYDIRRAHAVPLCLLGGYGYLIADDYASYNAAALENIKCLGCWAHATRNKAGSARL